MKKIQSEMIFDKDWVSLLVQATKNLSHHALIKDVLKKPNNAYTMLKESFSKIHRSDEKAILRVFVDNGQRYDLLEKLRNTSYRADNDLDEWIQKTIGSNEYTITFNGVTKWSDKLHTVLTHEVVNEMIKMLGAPFKGIDIYAFVANAGYTPFGIHDDRDHSIIFHLGPAEKHVWVWPRALYLELMKKDDRCFDVESIKSYGDHLVMEPGDCLFIPKGDFHIFENVGFSAFLGLILFPSTASSIARESISILSSLHGDFEESLAIEKSIPDRIYTQLNTIFHGKKENAFDLMELAALYKHFLLKSNGYSIHKPRISKVDKKDFQEAELWKPTCFPILSYEREERIALFIRGRLFEVRNIPGLLEAVEFLNEQEYHNYDELICKMTRFIPKNLAELVFEKIFSYRGIFPLK